MLNHSSHLITAKNLLSAYGPGQPFHLYLKSYFRLHKKHGSRDRKLISTLCYNYFRLGFALQNIPADEKILTGFFLCEQSPSAFLQSLKPLWNNAITYSLGKKLEIENISFEIQSIFPYKNELSDEVDADRFNLSFLYQPKLYVRIRPGFTAIVLQKLQTSAMPYEVITDNCIALPNSSKIEAVIDLDREAVVQDFNSQRVGELLKMAIASANGGRKPEISAWDCCAASGGKSIMAYDIDPSIKLTVSDKRKSILDNLKQRFFSAGIKDYQSFVADLSAVQVITTGQNDKTYDLIIADVPCTGSGTWARSPEQLYYFDQKQIKKYSALQKQIVKNVVSSLKPGGFLLYVTCSVFKRENEDIAYFIKDRLTMNLVKMELLKGYEMQADTMFAALFVRQEAD